MLQQPHELQSPADPPTTSLVHCRLASREAPGLAAGQTTDQMPGSLAGKPGPLQATDQCLTAAAAGLSPAGSSILAAAAAAYRRCPTGSYQAADKRHPTAGSPLTAGVSSLTGNPQAAAGMSRLTGSQQAADRRWTAGPTSGDAPPAHSLVTGAAATLRGPHRAQAQAQVCPREQLHCYVHAAALDLTASDPQPL